MIKKKNQKTRKQSGRENTLKVLGKGDKERIVSYGVNLQKIVFKYINQERPEPASKKIDSLFLKNDGVPITQATIKQLFRRLKDKLKMEKLHPHLCRHTFCTMYLANGGDIFSLKQMTGHESFEILNNYVHLASSMVSIKNRSLSLLDDMEMAEKIINNGIRKMQKYLFDREKNIPLPEAYFPQNRSSKCKYCNYREICLEEEIAKPVSATNKIPIGIYC